jgi:hypothetical protein
MFHILIPTTTDYTDSMISNARLSLQFDVEKPVELVDLTLALGSFANQYQRFIEWKTRGASLQPEELKESIKLYITKIESNCIITELAAYSATSLPVIYHAIEHAKTYAEFAKFFNSSIKVLTGEFIPERWQWWKSQRRDFIDWSNVLAPVAKIKNGKVNLSVKEQVEKDTVKRIVEYSFESREVIAAQQGAIKQLEASEFKEAADYKSVLMHMPQMHQNKTKKTGKTSPDMGIIETIYPKELPVFWLSDMDAKKVKGQAESPFKLNYVVDVNVQTVAGAPRAYRILRLCDILREPEQEAEQ